MQHEHYRWCDAGRHPTAATGSFRVCLVPVLGACHTPSSGRLQRHPHRVRRNALMGAGEAVAVPDVADLGPMTWRAHCCAPCCFPFLQIESPHSSNLPPLFVPHCSRRKYVFCAFVLFCFARMTFGWQRALRSSTSTISTIWHFQMRYNRQANTPS
jgi:hypothetical protein